MRSSGRSLYFSAFALMAAPSLARAAPLGVLDPVGPIGVGDKTILIDSVIIMLAVIVPVIVLTLGFAWWFRAGNAKAKYLPEWEYSGKIELVVCSIPAMIVLFLGGVAWVGSHLLDPHYPIASKQKPLQVEVVSMDWKWLFIYPEQKIASVNQLALPIGVPVEFTLTSADVMNSFFVPRLGSQIYTMAGMTTHINLQADQPGTYQGLSAQFSGDGFSDMRFDAIAMPQAGFDQWVAQAKAGKDTLDQPTYDALSQPSKANAVVLYHDVDDRLFSAIVQKSAPGSAMSGDTNGTGGMMSMMPAHPPETPLETPPEMPQGMKE